MSTARKCQVGDKVTTDYNARSGMTEHTIIGRMDMRPCQSGIGFQVDPPLRLSGRGAWVDADWFEPANAILSSTD